jgi:pimeloyl-ACP methyl ester carboxylesterase
MFLSRLSRRARLRNQFVSQIAMNDKQRRLIDYFSKLPEPAPPRRPASLEGFEESVSEGVPVPQIPSTPSAESVKTMLEKRLGNTLLPSEGFTSEGGMIEEGILPTPPPAAAPPLDRPITVREVAVAVSATEKVLNDQELSFEEQDIMEAIVLPGKRPVLDIVEGDFSTPPPGWEWLADYRQVIRTALPSVGRIDIPELQTAPYGGTGFFVGDGLLMTNRHVARIFVQGVGAGPKYLTFLADRTAFFDSQYEVGDPGQGSASERFEVIEAKVVHPHWDVAILKVKSVDGTELPRPLKLARQMPPGFGGGAMVNVAVIGYPMLDTRNDIAEQMNIFRRIFGRKRLMPGYMTGFGDVKTKWDAMLHATIHDASTLGGNSGSAVIDLSTGQVLSLHFGGQYLKANYGVPTWELALDSRVVDLGLNFTDYPGVTVATQSSAPPVWTKTWDGLTPLVVEENAAVAPVAPVPGGTSDESVLPVAPDWFERISDVDLLEAMRRNRARTERLIRETLLPKEADDLIGDLQRGLQPAAAATTEEGIFDFLLGADKVDPSLPEIIFLHGIMGGHLAAYGGLGGRIWLSPLAFAAGGVASRLMLSNDGLQDLTPDQILYPDGPIRLVYEKPARKWRMQGFVVHEFSFDWRKPVTNAAERLHLFIESLRLERPAKKFALVGHSMGGCVSAVYAASHPEWSSRISQTIFMGAPLRGSFAPIEALLGTYPILPKIALVDAKNNLGEYVTMARTLPGLLDLLPDPETFPSAASLYERATWPTESAPAQVWLDQSRQMKRVFATSPILETARLIVTPGVPTVGDVGVVGGQLQPGRRNLPGDGTVPTRSAAGVRALAIYRATSEHGTLPREDAVIKAVRDLLKNGTCDLPPLTDAVINDVTPIEESITEAIEEATSADLTLRMKTGIFTQRDADFLLRADKATLPGPVGTLISGGV